MAITTTMTNSYKQDVLSGTQTSTDTYKIALYTSLATLDASTTVYSATNEVVGTGYTAGGNTLSGFTTGLSGSTAYLTFTNPSWTTSTITARGCLIYNVTQGNKSVAAYDFGANITSTAGTFTVNFPAVGATALIRIA
jgi:hypothetical protein